MVQIPNGSAATCSFDLTDSNWPTLTNSPDSLLNGINDELAGDGLVIGSKSLAYSALGFAATGEFSGTCVILNQSGQELDDTDMSSQFQDAMAQEGVTGLFSVLSVSTGTSSNTGTGSQGQVTQTTTGAGAAAQQGTGKCPNGVPSVHNCGDPCWGITDDFTQYIKCLTTGGLTTIGLLAIGLLVGVVLIVGMKNRP